MMRIRLLTLLVPLVLLVSSCVPGVSPVAERVGDTVVITITTETPLYDATLQVFDAVTTDPRCVPLGETDVGCLLGDVLPGEPEIVTVFGPLGAVDCILFGFSDPALPVSSYRPYPCQIGGSS